MAKSNVSELIALGMNETLDNEEFKSLFGVAYKQAGHQCKEDHEHTSECGDASYADDKKPVIFDPNFGARPVPGPKVDTSKADDGSDGSSEDTSHADDSDGSSEDTSHADDADESDADDKEEEKKSTALALAVEGLVRVSALLDTVGFEKSATTTLNLAGLIAEAKKKVEDKKKKKKEDKKKGKGSGSSSSSSSSSKGSSSKDSNDARDKAKAKKKKEEEEAKKKKERDTQMAKDKKAKEEAAAKKAKEKEAEAKKKAKEKAEKEKKSK